MKKLLLKKLYISLLYVVPAILIEIVSFLVLGLGVIPEFWGLDLAIALGIGVFMFVLPSCTASLVIGAVFLGLQCVLTFINEALLSMSGMVFSLTMLNLAKEVGGVFNSDFVNWWLVVGVMLFYGCVLAGSIVLNVKYRAPRHKYNRNFVILLLVCCLVGENLSVFTYQITKGMFQSAAATDVLAEYNDDEYLYTSQFLPAKALKKFGTFGFYMVNATNAFDSLFGSIGKKISADAQDLHTLDNYFLDGEMSADVYGDGNLYTGALGGKNIVLIVIESGEWYAINKEYTPTLYSMVREGISFTEYYARDKTNHSEAMSVLGSYPVALDPAAKLKKSEFSFTTPSLLQKAGYTTNYFHANTNDFYERNVTYGGGGLFGFDTAHFLENMPLLEGCNDKGEIVKKDFYDFDKDAYVTEKYYDAYTNKNPEDGAFFTMHMTISSHGHYDDLLETGDYTKSLSAEKKKEIEKKLTVKGFGKYYELIDDYPTDFALADKGIDLTEAEKELKEDKLETVYLRYKRYQAGMMDLDRAINSLVYRLAQEGELDDTAFMFYSDHTAYYNNQNYYLKGVKEDDGWNTKLYNIPCFIWYGGSMNLNTAPNGEFYDGYHGDIAFTATKDTDSPLKGGVKVDKFTCSFDILPTILQLAGYSYNLNLYQGVSMFSDLTSVFVSRESGIFTNRIYYDGITVSVKGDDGRWTQYDYERTRDSEEGFPADVDEFLRESIAYYDKQDALELMYASNYFKYRDILKGATKDGKKLRFVEQKTGVSGA